MLVPLSQQVAPLLSTILMSIHVHTKISMYKPVCTSFGQHHCGQHNLAGSYHHTTAHSPPTLEKINSISDKIRMTTDQPYFSATSVTKKQRRKYACAKPQYSASLLFAIFQLDVTSDYQVLSKLQYKPYRPIFVLI